MVEKSDPDFKKCNMCNMVWHSIHEFLEDPELVVIGYQSLFDDLGSGLFLFNHDCRTTIACNVEAFSELYDGPIYQDKRTDSESCPGYCKISANLDPCPVKCQCAYVRETLQVIKNWPKNLNARHALDLQEAG